MDRSMVLSLNPLKSGTGGGDHGRHPGDRLRRADPRGRDLGSPERLVSGRPGRAGGRAVRGGRAGGAANVDVVKINIESTVFHSQKNPEQKNEPLPIEDGGGVLGGGGASQWTPPPSEAG